MRRRRRNRAVVARGVTQWLIDPHLARRTKELSETVRECTQMNANKSFKHQSKKI